MANTGLKNDRSLFYILVKLFNSLTNFYLFFNNKTMKWLNYWRKANRQPKPSSEQQLLPSQPPTRFLTPSPRKTASQGLPCGIAVDPFESNLFYQSWDGKIVSRSLESGIIQWQIEASGYPLRVTDDILWVLQTDSIAAFFTMNGQLLLRSNRLSIPYGDSGLFPWNRNYVMGDGTLASNLW